MSLRLLLADRNADLFRQPVDIALRYGQPNRRELEQVVSGDRISDDADVVWRWALAGQGLVYES